MSEAALAEVEATEFVSDESSNGSFTFSIERNILLRALAHVQSVVEKRNTIPILSNVRLEACADNRLLLTATDMDIAITESVAASVVEAGELTVPAHTLYDIVRKLPDGSEILLKGGEATNGRVEIRSGKCDFSLQSLPVNDFPVIDKEDLPHRFTLSADLLTTLIDKTRFAISTEETRYYLNGIYLHIKNVEDTSMLVAVATDGHRLARMQIEPPEGSQGIPGVIVPRKTVLELKKLIENAENEVTISLSDTKICFECGTAVLLSKLIDGTFPDYERVIPSGNDKIMEVDAAALSKAVDRISTIASEKTRAIKFSLAENTLSLSASNEDNGQGVEQLEASFEGGTLEIGFNSRYILEMLTAIEGDVVRFTLADESAPALASDPTLESVTFVVMPMRI